MRIAKFLLYGSEGIQEYDERMDEDDDWIRTTEPIEVEFIDLPPDVTVPPQINLIDNKIAEARAEFNKVISRLEDKKKDLLAITHQAN